LLCKGRRRVTSTVLVRDTLLENKGHDYSGPGPRASAALNYWQRAGSSVAVWIRPPPHPDDEHARLELACDDHKEVDTDYRRQYSLQLTVHFFL